MKVFLDTNVLVSAFITETGSCSELFHAVVTTPEHYLITGEVVLEELQKILRDRFQKPEGLIQDFINFLRYDEVIPKPDKPFKIPEFKDKDDLWILASALKANADVLITGDKALLKLKKVENLVITNPAGFWDLIKPQ